jgi:hypothetical protein
MTELIAEDIINDLITAMRSIDERVGLRKGDRLLIAQAEDYLQRSRAMKYGSNF